MRLEIKKPIKRNITENVIALEEVKKGLSCFNIAINIDDVTYN